MADVEAQTQMLFLSGSPVVMAKSLCRIKESGGKALQQLFTIRRLTLMLKRTGSIRRTCFQTCCFFGVFIFFSSAHALKSSPAVSIHVCSN